MIRKIAIGVFCYNRVEKLSCCIAALLLNPECSDLEIIFFSDGWKGLEDRGGVHQVREYINGLTGFKNIIKCFRERNLTTGPNFKAGLEFMRANYDEFIIIEDDLLVSANYLKYLM